jgi:uncharacterized protein
MNTKVNYFQKYKTTNLVVYISLFFVAWYFWLTKLPLYRCSIVLFSIYVLEHISKLMIWTVPVFVYLKFCDNEHPWAYLKLIGNLKKGFIWGVLGTVLFIIYNLIGTFIIKGFLHFSFIPMNTFINIILVGFTEEILFRGFILQKITSVALRKNSFVNREPTLIIA